MKQQIIKDPLPLLWLLAIANSMLPAALQTTQDLGVFAAASQGFNHSFIVWLAIALCCRMHLQTPSARATSNRQLLLALAITALMLIPVALINWLAATALALLWRVNTVSAKQRAIATLMLAISCREPVIQASLYLLSEPILALDAHLAGALLWLTGNPSSISGNLISSGNHALVILTGCSAFGNLSLALLFWLSLRLQQTEDLTKHDYRRLAAIGLGVLYLNTVRLGLMGLGMDWYQLIHDGYGKYLFDIAILALPLCFLPRRTHHDSPDITDSDHSPDGDRYPGKQAQQN